MGAVVNMVDYVPKEDVIVAVPPFKIKYSDVFHLKNLYVMMHEFLVDNGWIGSSQGSSPNASHQDIEKLYMERHHQKALHRGGKEYWIWWRVRKPPLGKTHGYYEYRMDIDFHGMYIESREIMHHGKKIKVNKGEMEIEFKPKLVRSATAKAWKDHWLLKHFQDIYEARIISQEVEKMEKDLWRDAYRLQAAVKSYLNLRNFIPVAELFTGKKYGMEGEF
jgi:hypothetical protein